MCLAIFLSMTLAWTDVEPPPPADKDPVQEELHGEVIVDNYRWLEDLERDSEAVRQWTDDQNAVTRELLDAMPGRSDLEDRLRELLEIDRYGAPSMRGDRYFFTKREGGQDQAVLYVQTGLSGEPEVLLDPNALDDRGLYSLDWSAPDPKGERLAFGLSYAGDEMTVLYVLDVDSGQWLADEIPGKASFAGWAPDGSGFLYSVLEDPDDAYSRRFLYHELGVHPRESKLLLEQEEPSRIPFASLSSDGRWIVAGFSEGWTRRDLYAIDAAAWMRTGEADMVPIAEGMEARFSPAAVDGDTLYMFTDLDAPNGMVYAVDLNYPAQDDWRVVIPEREDAVLRSVSHARGMLVARYEDNAAARLERFRMDGEPLGEIALPGLGSAGIATHHDRTEAFVSYQSFNHPPAIYHTDLREDGMELWARPDVPGDYDGLAVTQEWAVSKDGTEVPMFIVHKEGLELDGDNPTILYGYGGFNISLTPSFSAESLPWYEQGGVYVVANLRGGGEFGREWQEQGRRAHKQNVFDDFHACAEHLIERGYTRPERLAIRGGSNGGLLTGAAVTQRPELFSAAISAVPLLDMLRYHKFLMAQFWVPEYGSPDDPEEFEWLRAYSPYHNIEEGREYPAVFLTAGENDNRVHPLHARKMAAALQEKAANDFTEKPVLLWVERESGHGAGKPLWLRVQEQADQWAFLMWQTGMLEPDGRE